jgi:predicted lipid-binding transport protein (Tim44 family)
MKCEEFQALIEEFVDGALDQRAAGPVTAHMNACAACSRFREELVREQELYSKYEHDVEVRPALWSSIEAQIKQDRAARPAGFGSRFREWMNGGLAAPRLSPAFAAALVVFAIGLTVAVMSYLNSQSRPLVASGNKNASVESPGASNDNRTAPAPAPAPAANPREAVANGGSVAGEKPNQAKVGVAVPRKNLASTAGSTPEQLVREAEQKYVTAIAMLTRDVNRRRSQLDPMMLARLDAALGDIDRTIRDTRRVVRENPEDPIALQYLLAAYSKKVDVLREMTASTD